MRKKLTQKQQKILDFIKNYIAETGYPPAVRDISNAFGMSSKGAYDHITAIEKKGYIRRDPSKPRAIELLDYISRKSPKSLVDIPVLGKVAAGEPLLANQNIEWIITVSKDMVKADEPFALRVKGDSMIGVGIFNNDFVIVKKQQTAEQGDIVVALIGDEATVKRFYKEDGYIRLQPENPTMLPIITKDVVILGKVIGLFREI